jgi:hypothetical protein
MSREIIDVSENNAGFRVTFEDGGQAYCTRYRGARLLGFNGGYLVVEDFDYYFILTPNGDVTGSIQKISGRVQSVTGNSVVIRDGAYLKCYDMRGNLKSTRQVF